MPFFAIILGHIPEVEEQVKRHLHQYLPEERYKSDLFDSIIAFFEVIAKPKSMDKEGSA